MYLGVCFLSSNLFGTLRASRVFCTSISFARLGKFSFIICSNKFSISCFSFSPPGTHMIQMLEHLKLSWRFLSLSSLFLSSFFEFLFLHSVPVGCLFFSFVPNCFDSWFPSCHCWFPEYFILFHFGYLSFVFSFFHQAQSVL